MAPPIRRKNLSLNCIDEYKSRMENIIKMNTKLDSFTDLKISDCTLELEGDQLPIARAISKMKNLITLQLERIELCSSTFLEIESRKLNQLYLCRCVTKLYVTSLFKNDLCYKDSLVELKLEGNGWLDVPDGIFQFRNLRKLSLSYNRITELPDKFTKLLKLQHLYLSHNQISHLPLSFIALRNLTELDLMQNLITELPNMFAYLSKLEALSLACNQLTSVPSSIFALRNLTQLDLHTNLITELPDKFANLSELAFLFLDRNQLRFVPPSILSLQNLYELSLSNNHIAELPDIINLPSLKELSLSNNPLLCLPSRIFTLHLKKLHIACNTFYNLSRTTHVNPSFGSKRIRREPIVHSLKELSYRTILKHKLKVKEGMLPEKLSEDLEYFRMCICGRKFVDGEEVFFLSDLKDVSDSIIYNRNNNNNNKFRFLVRGKMCTSFKSCLLDRLPKRK